MWIVPGIMPCAFSSGSRTSISGGLPASWSSRSSATASISLVLPRISLRRLSKVGTARDCHDPHVRVRCIGGGETHVMTQLATEMPAEPAGPESMVNITPVAASKVNEIRDAEAIEPTMALRLRVVGGGCAGFSYDLYFDESTEVDRQFEIQGVRVVVDEMSLMYLVGTEIDYVEGLQGAGFKFNNPNVKTTCGCGSSFSV